MKYNGTPEGKCKMKQKLTTFKSKYTIFTLLLVTLVVVLVDTKCSAQLQTGQHEASMNELNGTALSDDLVARGESLRKAIDDEYKRLCDAREVKVSGVGVNYITDIVAMHIPLGSTFDHAVGILKAADFTSIHKEQSLRDKNRKEMAAKINPYRNFFIGKVVIYVTLEPDDQASWRTVKNVYGEISTSYI